MFNQRRLKGIGSAIGRGLVASCLALSVAATASAQSSSSARAKTDDVARGLFQAGKAAFDAGNFDDALQYFEQSYARSDRPELQYNIGIAADRLRKDDKALASFKAYLHDVPNAENRDEVESRIRALEKVKAEREAIAAPTPEQTAHEASVTQTRNDAALTQADPRDEAPGRKPITKQWWFWTGVGAVVVGGVVTALLLGSPHDKAAGPIAGDIGGVVQTLSHR